jgi:NitT/TauT family transport system substrate-binding protein
MLRLLALLAVVLSIDLAAAEIARADDPPKLHKITMPVVGDGLHFFPLYVASAGGFFAKEGLDVQWLSVNGGTRQAAAVMGGSAEITPLGLMHVIKSEAEGGSLVAFADSFDSYAMSVVVSNEAMQKAGLDPAMPIDEKVKRLSGLKLGITSPGSSTDLLVRSLFLARGLDPDKALELQPFGTGPAMLAAFEKKISDGFVFAAPWPDLVVAKGLGKVVIDPFTNEIPELENVPYIVMVTSRQTWEREPETIKAVTRALTATYAFIHEHPKETIEYIRPSFKNVDPEIFTKVAQKHLVGVPKTPVITREQVERTTAWMNLGASKKVTASFDDVVVSEPARDALAMVKP